MHKPFISICIVTYNQSNYIRRCVQSIAEQEVNCDFEIIVGDDCSTDGTSNELERLKNEYPHLIRIISHKTNVGPIDNYFSVHNAASGKYIAHLDGDDYALPGKLQVLKSYLDANPECNIVWHRMIILNEKGQTAIGMPVVSMKEMTGQDKFYFSDLAKFYGMTGCHSGSMYRATAKSLSKFDKPTIDYYITLSFLKDGGYAAYIDQPFGVYRFFSQDQTLTRQKGGMYVGVAKLDFMELMLKEHPELKRAFAAQALFELFTRIYLRYPLKMKFLMLFISCKALPRWKDLMLIWRVFDSSRIKNLNKAFQRGCNINVF
jgi:glycosyltransferase involved in cell wall biosynthesis